MPNAPAISVIIPMYNVEKYIAETLESILAQTFTDFEVIIVNDCSTDNSRQIAESYIPKFDGRLQIFDNEKNSGPSTSRNNGLLKASGEYVFFMDADDLLKSIALEELVTLAKNHDAEVVYCEKHFKSDAAGKNLQLKTSRGAKRVNKPTLESENLAERVEYISRKNFWGVPWNKLVSRNLLLENEIFFPNLRPCEDHIWTFGLFFFAKRFLRIPNAVYIWRMSSNSATRSKHTPKQEVAFWLNATILGSKYLDQMMFKLEFFQQNLQYRYAMLEKLSTHMFDFSLPDSLKLPQYSVYEAIKDEFGDRLGEYDVLISLLCSIVNKYQKIIQTKNKKISQLEKQLNTN